VEWCRREIPVLGNFEELAEGVHEGEKKFGAAQFSKKGASVFGGAAQKQKVKKNTPTKDVFAGRR